MNVLFSIADAGINSTNLIELLQLIVEHIAHGISADRVALITIDQAKKKINDCELFETVKILIEASYNFFHRYNQTLHLVLSIIGAHSS